MIEGFGVIQASVFHYAYPFYYRVGHCGRISILFECGAEPDIPALHFLIPYRIANYRCNMIESFTIPSGIILIIAVHGCSLERGTLFRIEVIQQSFVQFG